ncbi:MAG: rhodanese-like domain-containing protein, partial [Acidimicrobiia bacterium]|nr:rhodanese-like domain-containing protein [Acidimicrobiia bacterium]
ERKEAHPPRSIHISLESLERQTHKLEGRKVLAICHSGNRSGTATRYLNSQGIETMNIRGGMLAWERAGLPVKRGK